MTINREPETNDCVTQPVEIPSYFEGAETIRGSAEILKRSADHKSRVWSAEEAKADGGRTKYLRTIYSVDGVRFEEPIDVYSVCTAFDVKGAPMSHAIKKMLCLGLRGKADAAQELDETIVAIKRAIVELEQRKRYGLE